MHDGAETDDLPDGLIGAGARLLILHPAECDRLLADPSLIGAVVEEVLRFEPPVDSTGRVVSRDLELGGCPVHPRQAVQPSIRAANRDPAAFEDPDRFDISRKRAPHVAFGGGAHICLGPPWRGWRGRRRCSAFSAASPV